MTGLFTELSILHFKILLDFHDNANLAFNNQIASVEPEKYIKQNINFKEGSKQYLATI